MGFASFVVKYSVGVGIAIGVEKTNESIPIPIATPIKEDHGLEHMQAKEQQKDVFYAEIGLVTARDGNCSYYYPSESCFFAKIIELRITRIDADKSMFNNVIASY